MLCNSSTTTLTFVELFQTLELRSEAAFGSGVDDKDDLALQVGEWVRLAALVVRLKIVEAGGGCHSGVIGMSLAWKEQRESQSD